MKVTADRALIGASEQPLEQMDGCKSLFVSVRTIYSFIISNSRLVFGPVLTLALDPTVRC